MRRLFAALLLLLAAGAASAHKPSDSYLTLHAADSTSAGARTRTINGQWDIALRDLDFAIGLDTDGDGRLTWDEVRSHHEAIAAYAMSRLAVSADGAACPLKVTEHLLDHHTDGAYAVLRLQGACAAAAGSASSAPVRTLQLRYTLFADVDAQHRGLVRIVSAGEGEGAGASATSTHIVGGDTPELAVSLEQPAKWRQFADYLRHGVWHIWIGYDHILFLLSLLLPAVLVWRHKTWQPVAGIRPAILDVLKIVTAFTLAHSITLSLAALQVVNLPSNLVESAIAASVAVAAANNIIPVIRGKRWLAAFVFGLVHGFGFASVLSDLGLPGDSLLLALVGFNLGVELGQLAIVAAFLPLAYAVRATWLYRRVLLTGGSSVIVLLAAVWLAERI
jgi:hypothetical protein